MTVREEAEVMASKLNLDVKEVEEMLFKLIGI